MVGSLETYTANGEMQFGTADAVDRSHSKDGASDADMADAQSKLDKLLSEQLDLQSRIANASPDQKAALESALGKVSGGIGALRGAITNRSGIAMAIMVASGAIASANSAETTSEGLKAHETGERVAAQASQGNNWNNSDFRAMEYSALSKSAKATYDSMSTLNIGGFNDLDANGVALDDKAKVHYAARTNASLDAATKTELKVAAAIEKDPAFKAIKDEKTKEATVAQEKLQKTNDPSLTAAAKDSQKMSQQVEAPDLKTTQIAKDVESGQISTQAAAAQLKQANAERKQAMTKVAQDTFSSMGKNEQAILRQKFNLNDGESPTSEQMWKMRKTNVDHKAANDAAYVMAVHGEKGFAKLTAEQKEAYVLTQAKMNLDSRRTAMVTQEFYKALSPEEQKQFNEQFSEHLKNGQKDTGEFITAYAAEHKIDTKLAKQMTRATKDVTAENFNTFSKAAVTTDTADDVSAYKVIKNSKVANELGLKGDQYSKFVASDVLWSSASATDFSNYDFSTLPTNATTSFSDTKVPDNAVIATAPATSTTASGGDAQAAGEVVQVRPAAPSLVVSPKSAEVSAQETPKKDFATMLQGSGFSAGVVNGGTPATVNTEVATAKAPTDMEGFSGFAGLTQGLNLSRSITMPANQNDVTTGNLVATTVPNILQQQTTSVKL